MIGHYPYVILAFLLIHPHSTNQSVFSYETDDKLIEKQLREEKPFLRSVNKTLSKHIFFSAVPSDIVCDGLSEFEKKKLCNETMELMIDKDHGDGTFESFLKVASDVEAPQLAKSMKPYVCEEISIEGIDMEKNMYWCDNRVYKNGKDGQLYPAAGFFIAGSAKVAERAFLFRQSEETPEKVAKWAKIDDVYLLQNASISFPDRCVLCRGESSSSSRGH